MKKISKRIFAQQPMTTDNVAVQRAIDVRRDQLKANLSRTLQQLNTILADNRKSNEQKVQEMGAIVGVFSKQIDTTFQQLKGPTVTVAPGAARTAAKKKDVLPGGVGDDIPYEELNKEQLEKGIKVELEHTDDPDIAKEIAGDHLSEQLDEGKKKEEQDYYTELEKIEPHHKDEEESECDTVIPAFWKRNLDYGE